MSKERDAATIKAWARAFFAREDSPKIRMTDEEYVTFGDCFTKADPLKAGFSMGIAVKKEICPACEAGIPKKEHFIIKKSRQVPKGQAYVIGSDFRLISFSFVEDPIDRHAVIKEVVSMGTKCTKCKQDYPYAENRAGFVCWACRNGY